MKWLEILKAVGPIVVLAVAPQLAPVVGVVLHAVEHAEQLPGAPSSAEKLDHAVAIILDGASVTNTITKKALVDGPLAVSAVKSAVSAVVDAANLIHQAKKA